MLSVNCHTTPFTTVFYSEGSRYHFHKCTMGLCRESDMQLIAFRRIQGFPLTLRRTHAGCCSHTGRVKSDHEHISVASTAAEKPTLRPLPKYHITQWAITKYSYVKKYK